MKHLGFPVLLQGPIALGVEATPHSNLDSLTIPPCLLLFLTPTLNCPHMLQAPAKVHC